ncbi:dihydrolipoyl dehydrogenase [Desulfobulbus alkaliphilus]|uniref:dihydrolipoyl dehydrogenase n=1 Tax=Desulfobulbus alkaliphilus TaxID=869814 RepID=UPI0019663700|nr:dihydrolipoyl dehydrogenase [Desulfobulbus alkaliphilus]MBM9538734.1 dihydrolipoyl dehydrogenase [Desulfobulbus alkaliphilus]
MSRKIVVMGGGPGGYVAALRAASQGADVTLIEKEHLGGTCLNWGCIPSKIMKNSAEILHKCRKAKDFGIHLDGAVLPDMAGLMARKEKILDSQRTGIAGLLQGRNVHVEKGCGRITGRGTVQVTAADGTITSLRWDKLIIATGTRPMNVPDFPFDGKKILSSNDILALNHIPESLTIVGGGVIGCEFACIFSALGTKVTVVEAMSRVLPLPSVDASVSRLLLREMKKQKVTVCCDTVVTACATSAKGCRISLCKSPFTDNPKAKDPKTDNLSSDLMLVCIGRTPLSSDLGLETIGLKIREPGWIPVNDRMETGAENVYAIGDILGPSRVMLAHVASHEGQVAADNAMGQDAVLAYNAVPSAIFTMPEIGTVGMSEEEALQNGLAVDTASVNFRVLGKAHAIDEIAGEAKMVVEKDTGRILGVHLIGAHATDLIAEATLAVAKGLTAQDMAQTIHAHPTLAEIMGEVAAKTVGSALHG